MLSRLKYLIAVLTATLAIIPAVFAENGKFYTKKALLEDFPARVTKVVLSGDAMADAVLKEEISLRWNLSPYEFCTVDEYNVDRTNSNFFFLRFVRYDDVVFLSLDKGGDKNNADVKKQSFEVIAIPVSGADAGTMDNLEYMPAFVDIIQDFVIRAMDSDGKAYGGLTQYNISVAGKDIYLDRKEAARQFSMQTENALCGILVAARKPHLGSWCYRMLVSCDTHELMYFKKHKVTASQGAGWLKSEVSRFDGKSSR